MEGLPVRVKGAIRCGASTPLIRPRRLAWALKNRRQMAGRVRLGEPGSAKPQVGSLWRQKMEVAGSDTFTRPGTLVSDLVERLLARRWAL